MSSNHPQHQYRNDEDILPSYAEATSTIEIPACILRVELASIHKSKTTMSKVRSSLSSSSRRSKQSKGGDRNENSDEADEADEEAYYDGRDEIFIQQRRRDKVSAAILQVLTSRFCRLVWKVGRAIFY